jgi:hypothetical protein
MTGVPAPDVNLLVVRSPQHGAVRRFYEALGVPFVDEQHGRGPAHAAAVLPSGLVFEVYPSNAGGGTGAGTPLDVRLGFAVDDVDAAVNAALSAGGTISSRGDGRALLRDPDGRAVEVTRRVERTVESAIAAAYWRHYEDPELEVEAWEVVHDVGRGRPVDPAIDPMRLFVELARTAADDTALAYLGAGPLEDYLRVDDLDVEALARTVEQAGELGRAFANAYLPADLPPGRATQVRRALGRPEPAT